MPDSRRASRCLPRLQQTATSVGATELSVGEWRHGRIVCPGCSLSMSALSWSVPSEMQLLRLVMLSFRRNQVRWRLLCRVRGRHSVAMFSQLSCREMFFRSVQLRGMKLRLPPEEASMCVVIDHQR